MGMCTRGKCATFRAAAAAAGSTRILRASMNLLLSRIVLDCFIVGVIPCTRTHVDLCSRDAQPNFT